MAPTCVVTIYNDGVTTHTALNIPIGHFRNNLSPSNYIEFKKEAPRTKNYYYLWDIHGI